MRDASSVALADRMAPFTEREQVVDSAGLARAGREVRQLKPEIADSRAIARYFPGCSEPGAPEHTARGTGYFTASRCACMRPANARRGPVRARTRGAPDGAVRGRPRLGFPAWQHEPQRTALEVLVDQPRRQHRYAGSVNGECAKRGGGITAKHCVHTHARFALSMYENPAVQRVAGRVRKRVMLREGLWCSRFPALLQVGGRGHQDAAKRHQVVRDDVGAVWQHASDAYGDVDTFECELDQTILET